ncbi:MAG: glutamate--tRNA ligase [Tissierellia bacterium]|nr:glutamate--tRNA ligase [Tissierellia bacterium]
MKRVRVRFAPSPTGYMHIGGLRTALYNYLFAKQHGGDYLLRIEDTDQTRFVEGAIENLLEALDWSGLHHNEGVVCKDGEVTEVGDCGPYIQSKRLGSYHKAVDKLLEQGDAYHCFCTKERLDEVREEQRIKGNIPRYDGFCRGLTKEEAQARIDAGEKYVVRMKLPHNEDIVFEDLIRGKITINTADMDDQVLLKSDGFPTYHLAVVVDDESMGISHIIRGEEWLPSTPKHICLYRMMGYPEPTYVHLPTVLNKDRKKLSKRQGDVAVEDFRAKGYLPEGIINYLALIGWSPEDNRELFTLEELVEHFTLDRVSKTGGIFDLDKLNWVNQQYIKVKPGEELAELCAPYLLEAELMTAEEISQRHDWLVLLLDTVKEGMQTLADVVDRSMAVFTHPIPEGEAMEMLQGEQVPLLLDTLITKVEEAEFNEELVTGLLKSVQKETGIKGKNLFMPTRIALTGQLHGPDLTNLLRLLGNEEIIKRLKDTNKILGR